MRDTSATEVITVNAQAVVTKISAARFVEEKHAATPYTDTTLAAMYADFDDYLETH